MPTFFVALAILLVVAATIRSSFMGIVPLTKDPMAVIAAGVVCVVGAVLIAGAA